VQKERQKSAKQSLSCVAKDLKQSVNLQLLMVLRWLFARMGAHQIGDSLRVEQEAWLL